MEKITDFTGEAVELLPARDTLGLSFHVGDNFALVLAANTSSATNGIAGLAWANSLAAQSVNVVQH